MRAAPRSRTARLSCLLMATIACAVVLAVPAAAGEPGAAAGRGAAHTVVGFGDWEPFIGSDLTTPAIPDYYANYFSFAFTRRGEARYIGLRFTGQFGYARYMSYNIYRAYGSPSYGGLLDEQLHPAPGSVNPFVPGTDPDARNRSYVVAVQPQGYATDPRVNTLEFDPAQIRTLVVGLRYYVPQGSATAGVPLPVVEAYDVRTGEAVPLPEPY